MVVKPLEESAIKQKQFISDAGHELKTPVAVISTNLEMLKRQSGEKDSANYNTYDKMVAAYKEDIAEIEAGDKYGNNIVDLYHPLNYIGAEETQDVTWAKIIMGASEGDISMFNSLNLQIVMLNAGVDAAIEWQWNGGHVPSETLGDSFSLYVDQMYGKYADGAVTVEKKEAVKQITNGTAVECTGTDISEWINCEDIMSLITVRKII